MRTDKQKGKVLKKEKEGKCFSRLWFPRPVDFFRFLVVHSKAILLLVGVGCAVALQLSAFCTHFDRFPHKLEVEGWKLGSCSCFGGFGKVEVGLDWMVEEFRSLWLGWEICGFSW